VTLEEARDKLETQIEVGHGFLEHIRERGPSGLEDGERRWADYNETLLKMMFDDPSIGSSYTNERNWASVLRSMDRTNAAIAGMPRESDSPKARMVHQVQKQITFLESVRDRLELYPKSIPETNRTADMRDESSRQIDVFISHSSQDALLARQVVDLLRSALALRADHIRCTSVDGFGLPAGADVDDYLRDEALNASVVIGILSPFSMASAYVLFELGARWGAKKPLVPLLAPGVGPQALRGPLTRLNALSCDSASQLHQLVADVAAALGAQPESAAVYQTQVDAIMYSAHTSDEPQPSLVPAPLPVRTREAKPTTTSPTASSLSPSFDADAREYADAEEVISRHCEREWPDDYSMRSYCIEQQRQAVRSLRQGGPGDIPPEIFARIRAKCAHEWPDDYSMRHYAEQQQIAGYRQVHSTNKGGDA
jgi:TIR domain